MPSYPSVFGDLSEGNVMAQERLPMRKIKKVLEFHFEEGRSAGEMLRAYASA